MEQRGISPATLARTLGVADAQVSRWRRGQVVPTVRSLQRIADAFGVPRASLDKLAGYPVAEASDAAEPELEAAAGRLRELLESVPPPMRSAYVDACAALAEAISSSLDALLAEAQGGGQSHSIGFRPGQEGQ